MEILIIFVAIASFAFGWIASRLRKEYVGVIRISETRDGKKLYSLELNGDPEYLDSRKDVLFKIGSLASQD